VRRRPPASLSSTCTSTANTSHPTDQETRKSTIEDGRQSVRSIAYQTTPSSTISGPSGRRGWRCQAASPTATNAQPTAACSADESGAQAGGGPSQFVISAW
jgi:hypothetical protein